MQIAGCEQQKRGSYKSLYKAEPIPLWIIRYFTIDL